MKIVGMGLRALARLLICISLGACASTQAQINSWISDTGGNWGQGTNWSLGIPPASGQSIFFTNAFWKAVVIDSSTVSSAPLSLAVNSLTITSVSPTNGLFTTRNTLLLNYAEPGNALVIGVDANNPGSLLIDSNSTVAMFYSGLIVNDALGAANAHLGEFQVDGNFIQSDNSEVVAGFLDLNGTYNFTNSQVFIGTQFINGTFNQAGGTNTGSVEMHGSGVYNLIGGTLLPGDFNLGARPVTNLLTTPGGGILQSGGLNNPTSFTMSIGYYDMTNGVLQAPIMTLTTNVYLGGLYAGIFTQYGGYVTNGALNLIGGTNVYLGVTNRIGALYNLYSGTLETPSITMNAANFVLGGLISGSTNRVGTLSLNASFYLLNTGGLLVANQIQLSNGSEFTHQDGAVAGTMNITMANGSWWEQTSGAQFGQLQLLSGTNSGLYLASASSVLQFANSSGVPWANDGVLVIHNWSGSLAGGGSQQIFFGTSASGLTAQQLTQVQFINPPGLPGGTYSAQILSTGEVVPNQNSSGSGPVNSWINPGSGNWDQPTNWSLGVLPNSSQSVVIANTNWKAVAINPSTPTNFPRSMTVSNLFIEGATNTENTLLLNYFGTAVPLTILNGLTLRDGAQILNLNSALVVDGGTFMATNSDIIQDGGLIHTTNQMILNDSHFYLSNGVFEAASVAIGYPTPAAFNQYGGTATITNVGFGSFLGGAIPNGISLYGGTLNLPNGMYLYGEQGGVSYYQSGGTNRTGQVTIEADYGGFVGGFTLNGGLLADSGVLLYSGYHTPLSITQGGGTHVITNTLVIKGSSANGFSTDPATYNLNGGALFVGTLELDADEGDSVFNQTNSTVSAGTVYAHSVGYFSSHNTYINFYSGSLSCSNFMDDDGNGQLNQSGGDLVVSNLLEFSGSRDFGQPGGPDYGHYNFSGGTLSASNINMGGAWIIGPGTNRVSNSGTFTLSHLLQVSNVVEQLGHFILASNSTIDLTGASHLSFANSSGQVWNSGATLVIADWNGNASGGGAEQLKFGGDSSGLTPAQLNQILFNIGTNQYVAKILSTGEVVPNQAIAPNAAFSIQGNNFVVTWPAGWTLQSATNSVGPYSDVPSATSPYTNDITLGHQRFFRLRQ